MLTIVLAVAAAASPKSVPSVDEESAGPVPVGPALPAEEERLETGLLEEIRIPSAVPAWPDVRQLRQRSNDNLVLGLAVGAVGGILVASVIPDRRVLRERWFHTLSDCEKKQAMGLLIGCI